VQTYLERLRASAHGPAATDGGRGAHQP